MAYSIGLNRDPEVFKPTCKGERINNLGRKIWHNLVVSDFVNAYTYGNSLVTRGMFFDTKPPFNRDGNENILDKEKERAVIGCQMFGYGLINSPMKKVLELNSSMGSIKMSELTKYINALEICTKRLFGELGDYINFLEYHNDNYSFTKTTKARIILSTKCFYLSVYCLFFVYYEKKKKHELSFFYLKKMLRVSAYELMPKIFPLMCNSQEIFGEGADMILNPLLERAIHIINEINVLVLIRLNLSLYRMVKDPSHDLKLNSDSAYKTRFKTLSELIVLVENCARICNLGASFMSQRYYYAWGINRANNYLVKVIKSEDFYAQNADVNIGSDEITTGHLNELITIVEDSLAHLTTIIDNVDPQVQAIFNLRNQPKEPAILRDMWSSNLEANSGSTTSSLSNNDPFGQFLEPNNKLVGFSDITPHTSTPNDFEINSKIEIDSLWLQMLALKNNNGNSYCYRPSGNHTNGNSSINMAMPLGEGLQNQAFNNLDSQSQNSQTDSFTNQLFGENEHLDLFNDLPLDQIFY